MSNEFSRSKLKQAGEVLRDPLLPPDGDGPAPLKPNFFEAFDRAIAWRDSHAKALGAGRMGLVTRTRTALGIEYPEVTQRHKRMATIIDKLRREPDMELGRMWDIAGCRVVVPTVEACYSVWDRWKARPPVKEGMRDRFRDYIDDPKPDGYRAIHLYVNYHGRVVEVQIRSEVMQQWAELSEDLDAVTHAGLKRGDAPVEVVEWMQALAEAMAIEERGGLLSDRELADLQHLRQTALTRLRHGRGTA